MTPHDGEGSEAHTPTKRTIVKLPAKNEPLASTPFDVRAALESPEALCAFIQENRFTFKHQVAADDRWIDVHEKARRLVSGISQSPKREALTTTLREGEKLSLIEAVLERLVEYRPENKSCRSRDRGIQAYLDSKSVPAKEVRGFITERKGLQATYTAWCWEKKYHPRSPRKAKRISLAAAAKEVRPAGGLMVALFDVDSSGRLKLRSYGPGHAGIALQHSLKAAVVDGEAPDVR